MITMLFSISELVRRWQISPKSVLHIGAHLAEESEMYQSAGWNEVLWIEANPALMTDLRKKVEPLGQRVIEAAIWHTTGDELKLKVASNGQSSSLLEFNTHSALYPQIVVEKEITMKTQRLDSILKETGAPDFCNLDIQGAELSAIKGFGEFINHLNVIYTEVNKIELYSGCAMVSEIDKFLNKAGFKRVATRWILGHGWGDALYMRHRPNLSRRIRGIHWPIRFYVGQIRNLILQAIITQFRRSVSK